jgi:hypothetical protein
MTDREFVYVKIKHARLRTAINLATVGAAFMELLWLAAFGRSSAALLPVVALALPFALVVYVGRAILLLVVDIADGVAELRQRTPARDPEG